MRPPRRMRLGVLVSGSGTNLQALLDAASFEDYPAEVAVVISNVPGAYALERARTAQIPAVVVDHKAHPDRGSFERALLGVLREHEVELVCLAGFMRLLSSTFLRGFPHHVLNVHPALLPAFPGMHAARQAVEHGAKISGCTVHLVDEGTDTGPIIAQAAVPVMADDDEHALGKRIQAEEHRLFPLVVRLFAEGRVRVEGRGVKVDAPAEGSALSLRNPGRA